MKKILILAMFLCVSLFAIDKATALKMLEQNPDLINSPQAEQLLKEKGVDKSTVLNAIKMEKTAKKLENSVPVNNKVIIHKIKKVEKQNINNQVSKTRSIKSPLSFIKDKNIVQKIYKLRQIKKDSGHLRRFAEKFFYNRNKLNISNIVVPDYYKLNINDNIVVQIFGGSDKVLNLTVNSNGNVILPVLGPLRVANLSSYKVKELIKSKLKPTYPNSKIAILIKINSYIQVNLTGYVKAPGVYNLTSLSTIKDLLIAANGIGDIGSIRDVYLKRGGKTIKIIDFYKLIKDGKVADNTLLRNGDIVYIPKAKKLVKLYGSVNIPAIYDVKDGEKLKDIISFAGGLKPNGSKNDIKIKRYDHNNYIKTVIVNIDSNMTLKNGDDIYVYDISKLNRYLVYVKGNVDKPGTFEIPKDHLLKTLLKKVKFLKDTYYKYGLLVRFDDTLLSFDLKNPKDIKIKPKDTIYIFNKYEIEPNVYIKVSGDVVKYPGKYRYLKGMTLKDAINGAGLKSTYNTHKIQVVSYDNEMQSSLHFVDLDKNPDYKLHPYDEITLFSYYYFKPLKPITVFGEVNKPDTYVYSDNLTLKNALTMAGWLKDDADKNYIELIRYNISSNGERTRYIKRLSLKDLDYKMMPYDEITVKKIPKWYERDIVTLKGEVKYPGTYTINPGDTLYDVLKRAGGFTKEAYLYGAVFTRDSIRKIREKRLKSALYKLQKEVALVAASAKGAGETNLNGSNLIASIDTLIQNSKKIKPIGRISINLESNLTKFKNSPYNITLDNNDALYIPTKRDYVITMGEVLNEGAFVYNSDSAYSYLKQAGGLTTNADDIFFVVHANGISEKGSINGWFGGDVKVKPGDVIVAPIKIKTSTWYGIAKDMSAIVYKLAVTAASLKTVGAL